MDNPSLINEEASFPSSNEASYGLAEIWPFVVIGDGGELGWNLSRNSSVDGSTVTEQSGWSGRKRRDLSEEEESKLVSTSSGNEMNACDASCPKVSGSSEENGDSKAEMERSSRSGSKRAKQSSTQSAEPHNDYIHVRARRGQATDSHSLAERARREKISERMKILQDLIPGCNKVIGKALVLDEIINYIQSLQRQVEFLSMKLEAVNSRTSLRIEGFPFKDFGLQTFDSAGIAFGSHTTREFDQVPPAEWLHMQVGGGFERAT